MAGKNINHFTGRIRNLVFYKWKNKNCVRTIPSRIKQTEATKRVGECFGKAATMSKCIRTSLIDILPDHKESVMRLRFNNALYQWLRFYQRGDASVNHFINRFSFTEKGIPMQFIKKLSVQWMNDKVMITIPAFDITADLPAPRSTKAVELKFVLVGCDTKIPKPVPPLYAQVELDYTSSVAPMTIEFETPITGETLFIIVLSIRFKQNGENGLKHFEEEKWRMIGVLDSCYMP